MKLEELDYEINSDLIALRPKQPRDESKLLISENPLKIIRFKNIIEILNPGDVLVINDTKVIRSDITGYINKSKVSINLNKIIDKKKNLWSVFIKSNKKIQPKQNINLGDKVYCKIIEIRKDKNYLSYIIKFSLIYSELIEFLDSYGNMPLPAYIKKKRLLNQSDYKNYQAIFADRIGAVAAPTASLHFTKRLIHKIKKKGINIVKLTLHVNGGTFIPIKSNDIEDHLMHYEKGLITKESANKINYLKKKGGRVFAVGTTVLRLLESSKDHEGKVKAFDGETNIYIKPGWKINTIDALITNFHTPKSTLLLLIYAILGKKRTQEIYKFAIKNKLRFFSYGDACLIWNRNE